MKILKTCQFEVKNDDVEKKHAAFQSQGQGTSKTRGVDIMVYIFIYYFEAG
jgi:hypothetical protein